MVMHEILCVNHSLKETCRHFNLPLPATFHLQTSAEATGRADGAEGFGMRGVEADDLAAQSSFDINSMER
jgi:hypothetical protein